MRENSEILRTAEAILFQRRQAAQETAEVRRTEVCKAIPEYEALSGAIKRTGIRLGRIAIVSGTDTDAYQDAEKELGALSSKCTELLRKNGYPADYFETVYHCPECRDTGTVTENGMPRSCRCFMEIYTGLLMKESNLVQSGTFRDFDLSLYAETQNGDSPRARAERILNTAKTFVDSFGEANTNNLLFIGKTGVGKTFLCGCIAAELIARGVPVLYISAAELFSVLTYYGQDETLSGKRTLLEKVIYTVDLLIIDDLGTEKQSDTKYSILLDILNRRTGNAAGRRRTVISSNLTLKHLQAEYDERVFSRLASFEICELLGDDIRILKKRRG